MSHYILLFLLELFVAPKHDSFLYKKKRQKKNSKKNKKNSKKQKKFTSHFLSLALSRALFTHCVAENKRKKTL